MGTALVLAGGGVAGIAWELGVLRGIEEVAPDVVAGLIAADLILGTSAGATVAAQITGGRPLSQLFEDQVSGPAPEIDVDLDIAALWERFGAAVEGAGSALDLRRRIGALAVGSETVTEAERRAVIERRLPRHEWPTANLVVVAVDVDSGEERVFDRHGGTPLVDAVAASCAVPGVWPPVTIAGRRYMDGGARSSSNVDLAAGFDRILVLSPAEPAAPSLSGATLAEELAGLAPADVALVHADETATAAFGTNPLAASTRRPAAEAGRAQGLEAAGRIASWWAG